MEGGAFGKTPVAVACMAALLFSFFPPGRGACAAASEGPIIVAAAADLSYALKEIAVSFERETGVRVVLSFGSTGVLARQIAAGAPFDVFLAADEGYVNDLKKGGFVLPDTVRVYAYGALAIVVSGSSGLDVKDMGGLAQAGVQKIAIANPAHAPYGRAAAEAMKKAGVWEAVRDKLVYGENVRHALQFVQTGDAQAGIAAASLADARGVRATPVDEALHGPITQTGAVMRSSKNAVWAKRFLSSLAGPGSRAVLLKYGFRVPPAAATKKD